MNRDWKKALKRVAVEGEWLPDTTHDDHVDAMAYSLFSGMMYRPPTRWQRLKRWLRRRWHAMRSWDPFWFIYGILSLLYAILAHNIVVGFQ